MAEITHTKRTTEELFGRQLAALAYRRNKVCHRSASVSDRYALGTESTPALLVCGF